MFEVVEQKAQKAVIKVVGVGGCGSNAIDHMIDKGVSGVEFIVANTDRQALERNQAPVKLQIGSNLTGGLGAGAKPDVGRQAAEEDRDRLAEQISGADMLFITAGMGGGTGTGAAPVIAQIARDLKILTVAVVTKPFDYENRQKSAKSGLDTLAEFVDSLIVIPNEKLLSVLGDDVTQDEAFKAANDVLHGAVGGIAEIINCAGSINVDFEDVRTVMSEMGMAMMGSAQAAGIDRARIAAEQTINCPLLEDVNLAGARGVLVNITASRSTLKLKETKEIMNTIREFAADDATIIYGTVYDESMGDNLRVTLVATGLGGTNKVAAKPQAKPLNIVRTGTDDRPMLMDDPIVTTTSTSNVGLGSGNAEPPKVIRSGRARPTVEAMKQNGMSDLDIPAFLRKQAD